MKRSARVSLVLLASVSAAAALSGCEQTPAAPADNGGTFANKAECVAVYDQATCDAADKLAQQEHLQNAPHFSTQAQCAAEYGADMCRPSSAYGGQSGAGSFFVPAMLGYMMGSAMSTPAPLYYGRDAYRHRNDPGFVAPIYTSGQGYSRTAPIGRAPFASAGSFSSKPTISTKGSLKSSTAMTPPATARGGFGSSFKPTNAFKSAYASSNPSSFGRSSFSSTSGSSFSRAATTSGISSRGGFGGSGRSFGGGFGG